MKSTATKNLIAAAIAAALVIGVATDVAAGPGRDQRGGPAENGGPITRLIEELKLTPEQQTQVRAIVAEERTAAERLRADTRERIDALLTDEQRTQKDALIKKRLDRQVDRLADRLDLSSDQTTKVRAIMEERRDQPELSRKEFKERIAAVLTPEQLKKLESDGPRGGRHVGPNDGPGPRGDGPPDEPQDDGGDGPGSER